MIWGVKERQFQHHQKQAAFQQEVGRRPCADRPSPSAVAVKPGAQSRQGDEHRRAQMGRQPGEEQGRRRRLQVHRVRDLGVDEEELPRMVHQHQQDDQAAQGVDGTDTAARTDLFGRGDGSGRKRCGG
jgi:hypothetical protein